MSRCVLGFDLETTGRDVNKDRIIEFGAVVWNADKGKILSIYNRLVLPTPLIPLSQEIQEITGIEDEDLLNYGEPFSQVMADARRLMEDFEIEYVFSHNGERFDRPILVNELRRDEILNHPLERATLIDTMIDLPFARPPQSHKLNYLAHDHGFINPFPHRAFSDALTMMRIAKDYKLDDIIARRFIDHIVIAARVTFEENHKAKSLGYRWERVEDEVFSKSWVKRIRADQMEKELALAEALGVRVVKLAVWKRSQSSI